MQTEALVRIPSWLVRLVNAAVAVTVLTVLAVVYVVQGFHDELNGLLQTHAGVELLASDLAHMSDKASSSARMAVETGSAEWESRQASTAPIVLDLLDVAIAMAPSDASRDAAVELGTAQRRVNAAEALAMEALEAGRREEARAMLLDATYARDREEATRLLLRYQRTAKAQLAASLDDVRGRILWADGAGWAAFMATLGLWWMVARTLRLHYLSLRRTEAARFQALERVREGDLRIQSIVQVAPDAIVTVGEDGLLQSFNPAAERLFGVAAKDAIGRPFATVLWAPEHAEEVLQGLREESFGRRDAQHGFPMSVSVASATLPGGRVTTVILRDISARRDAEAHIRRLARALESSADGVIIAARNGAIEYVNPAFSAILGLSGDDVRGRLASSLLAPGASDALASGMQHALGAGRVWSGRLQYQRADGALKWVHATLSPVHDDERWVTAWVHMLRDIDEVVAAERRRARMSTMTSLSAVVTRMLQNEDQSLPNRVQTILDAVVPEGPADEGAVLVGEGERVSVWARVGDGDTAVVLGGAGSEIVVPLRYGARDRGVLKLRVPAGRAVDDAYREFLDDVAAQIAYAIAAEEVRDTLTRARRAAEEASQAKTEFLANMSHEIRTPLTAILGYSEIACDPRLAEDERAQHLRTIGNSADHLLALVNDILDLSRIEAGGLSIERIPVSPVAIAVSVADWLADQAAQKGLKLDVTLESAVPAELPTDPVRLRQILVNLVGNAVKFTEKGSVTLALGASDDRIRFVVSDTGAGIAERELSRLFQPFQQGDASTTRRFGGTGLGLTVSRRLARLLGGDIEVESELGRGSRFTLWLSLESLPEGTVWRRTLAPDRADAPEAPGRGAPLSFRVLVVEDNAVNRMLVRRMLETSGASVDTVDNGRDAVHRALATRPEVVLMDVMMPDVDGVEATRQLRAGGFDGVVVALTADVMDGARERCLQAGCDAFETKPIDRERLIRTLEQQVAARRGVDGILGSR